MSKQLYNMQNESPVSQRRLSMPDSARKSFRGFGGFDTTPGSLKKTALTNSRLSFSVRSNQSIPGIKSDYNIVESYGCPLPVVVNEALTFKDGPCTVSAKCTQSGWAWVVQGRRLLIWQYKDSASASNTSSPPRNFKLHRRGGALAQCRELTLPFCDIGHKSSLVSVFQTEGQQMASCIAVSASGDVRYWASIAHDGNSVDLANILSGQEFVQLINLPTQNGYLAVTTYSNLVFLRVVLVKGRYTLHHKHIKPGVSFLAGFGKKFASMLIGVNSADKEQFLVSMCCECSIEDETIVAVLGDRAMQRWRFNDKGNAVQLVYEDAELVRKIREEFQHKIWNMRLPAENVEIDMHLLDFHVLKNKSYILAGAVYAAHAPQMCYAMVIASSQAENMLIESFMPLKLNKFFNANTVQDCLSLRFIVSVTHIYLYTPKVVYPLLLLNPSPELEAEKIEFHMNDDRILSAAVCNHIPLFFSRAHGLVSITPGDFDSTDLLNMSTCHTPDVFAPVAMNSSLHLSQQALISGSTNNLHIYDIDPEDVYHELDDEVGQLKAAFLYSLKRNTNMSNTIITELLRKIAEADPTGLPVDIYKLDRIVVNIAEDLAEDLPISDPRWEEAYEDQEINRHALGSSRSMQIINQLREKSIALQHYIEFLHSSGVWQQLSAMPYGVNVLKPTHCILSDISEKIVGAFALRNFQSKVHKLIEEAIDATVAQWEEKPCGSLTNQDIFYVKLSRFQHIYNVLAEMASERIAAQSQSTVSVAHLIFDINAIVLETLDHVLRHREQQASNFSAADTKMEAYEVQPWTAMAGSAGVRDALTRLIDITVRYGAQCVTGSEIKLNLYQQIYEMVDIVLDGRKQFLDTIQDTEKYNVLQQQFEAQRGELISSLIKDKQYDLAAKLAEKYLDFQSLVMLCDETKDKDRLDEYTRRYEEYDFSQFAINWHLRQHRHGEVFERFKGNQTALAQFMRDHPSLGWIQLIFNGDFERAAKVLFELAQSETEFVERKKSMLSLAKLAAFGAADADLSSQVEKINTELTIIEYQLNLSQDTLQTLGFDPNDQRVLKVDEIINLYICEENENATEVEFRKALELLDYVENPYDMRHKIWCGAIRRDNWTDYDVNNALVYMHKLMFYKIIELSQLVNNDGDSFLPPMEDFLESTELDDLPQQKPFQYLLKLTYEYVADIFKQPEEMMEC